MQAANRPFAATPPRFFPLRPAWAWALGWVLYPLDRVFGRVYSTRYNPLYQSGPLAVLCLLVLICTGLYLLIFYRIGSAYESVAAIEAQWWGGRWIRALHGYAGDAMMIAIVVHLLRMALQGRTWGPRALAWISGVVLLGVVLLSGWTGAVLVWDLQAQLVAMEGARLADVLPIFSEPILRTFTVPEEMPSSFFFLNLILHMALPVGLLGGLWIHTLRVTRVVVLPPRAVSLWVGAGLLGAALVWPMGMMPKADPLTMLGAVPVDWFFNVWLLLARNASPPLTLAAIAGFGFALVAIPWWWRPGRGQRPQPSVSNELLCTGCTQCYQDCPYEAIAMVPSPLENRASELVAKVDPARCVSCGICAGSCAPMVIGPPNRAGIDHLRAVQSFYASAQPGQGDIVLMTCEQSVAVGTLGGPEQGVYPYLLHCAAAMHTSAIEYLLRRGVGGVYVLACPGRDCVNREGPKWMAQRLYDDREAELRERVDKRRVRLGQFARIELPAVLADLEVFRGRIAALHAPVDEGEVDVEPECEVMMEAAGD